MEIERERSINFTFRLKYDQKLVESFRIDSSELRSRGLPHPEDSLSCWIADWLSMKIVGLIWIQSSLNRRMSLSASSAPSVALMNSASVVERLIECYFLEAQRIGPPFNSVVEPLTDFLADCSEA